MVSTACFLSAAVEKEPEFKADSLGYVRYRNFCQFTPFSSKSFFKESSWIRRVEGPKMKRFTYTGALPINYAVRNKEPQYYVGTSQRSHYDVEPFTLFTLVFTQNHTSIVGAYEGMKYKFEMYSLLDRGFTDIVSRSVILYYSDDGKYHEYLTPKKQIKNIRKPTEEDWKDLKMDFMFKLLFDWKINGLI